MRKLLPLCLLPLMLPGAAALAQVPAPEIAAVELPVRAVTLSSSGLAQIERSGTLPAGAPIAFRAPLGDIDDLLKSLVVSDPVGSVVGLRLPARDLAAEAFQGLPVTADDFASRAALLTALRGQQVEVAGQSGRLAGAQETEKGLRVTLLTPTGLTPLLLEEGVSVRFTDPSLAQRLERAAEAVAAGAGADQRRIEIAMRSGRMRAGQDRAVSLTYVAGAPLWKPSWRLLAPPAGAPAEARLQGWAVVENRSGADWNQIRLSLVEADSAAFRQPLYEPLMVPRIELPLRMAEALRPQADSGARPAPPPPPPMAMAPAPIAPSGPMLRRERAAAAEAAMPAPAELAAPALAAASAGRVAFTLPEPVTLRGGETANLPFLDARLPAERVWWVQDQAARHPLQALRLTNNGNAILPAGLAAVFGTVGAEAGAFLGDAEIRAMAPGETRLLAFARDRDVLLTSAADQAERLVAADLQGHQLKLRFLRIDTLSFAVDPRGARGRLLLDLPRRPGSTPRFSIASEGDFGLRHEAVLDGKPTTLRLSYEREMRRDMPLWDQALGDPRLLVWRDIDLERDARRLPGGPGTLETLRELQARMPPEDAGTLARLVERMGRQRELLDAFRAAAIAAQAADAALVRARAAAEDRSGGSRTAARQALNAASAEAERTGAAADRAWTAWQLGVEALLGG
ncbi:hypothetical protein [Roseomonas sp. USHLN139]|uniref:hypothetical protein n=1 Tax=Roseomonas sp. USHLN139 TaxID=3081298 RepID=UPI003B023E09